MRPARFERATSASAGHTGRNDPGRRLARKAAFLHGFRAVTGLNPASLHRPDFGRLGH